VMAWEAFDMGEDKEYYTLTCETSDGVVVQRKFSSDDIHGFAYNVLQFTNHVGFDYIDMVEFSTESGTIFRAENL